MRINDRIYFYADEEKKLETQELENHNLEIYSLNDYPDLLEEFTNKGKFAVWSSRDGVDYRLFIEEGYKKEVKELYSKDINNIWLKFWDKCESIANKFRNIVLPLTIVILLAIFALTYFLPSPVDTILVISISVLFFVGVLIYRKISNKQFADANKESVDEIKKLLGEKRFERLLEKQRSYMDSYFKYEEEVEVIEEAVEDTNSEATEDKVIDVELEEDNTKVEESSKE